jgi:probable HAF family extracellular repeat protein
VVPYTTLDVPGATGATVAQGINDAGQIVGWFQDPSGNHGFLYSGGTYATLNDPSSAAGLTLAWGINDDGQIVGYYGDNGLSPSGAHGFLATPSPVPEPTSLSLILTGLAVLTRRRIAQRLRGA